MIKNIVINKLKQLLFYFENKEKKEQLKVYNSLIPRDDIKNKVYFNSLYKVLNTKGVNNIALSGSYGSGKSTIIKSFEKENNWRSDYKFLNISLATFKSKEKKSNDDEKKIPDDKQIPKKNNTKDDENDLLNVDIKEIEKGILQQMFYKVDYDDIPNSRFKRILTIKYMKIKTLGVFLWLLTTVKLFKSDEFKKIFSFVDIKEFENEFYLNEVCTIIFVVGMLYFIFSLMKLSPRIKLQKLSLQSPEINLVDESSKHSIMNKHLDEIIYFFESTKYNIVVIEDLDRFENPEIFIKLREINELLNKSKQINKEREIKFIYAIRDNIFEDKERTKFFDSFIPVIPVINSSNSYTKIKDLISEVGINVFNDEELKKEENKSKVYLSKRFIQDISIFIHDMRLLQNIFNEFIIYKNLLCNSDDKNKKINLNYDKLFAMSIYKNYNPSDFAELLEDNGLVYKVFNKDDLKVRLKEVIDKTEQEITDCKKDIKDYEKRVKTEMQLDVKELRAVYVQQFFKCIDNNNYGISYIYDNENGKIYLNESLEDDSFNKFKELSNIKYYNYNQGLVNSRKSFKDLEKEVNPERSYNQRINIIENKYKDEIEACKVKISELKETINNINQNTLQKLVLKYNEKLVLGEKLYNDKVLSYLIRYGYLDETYHNYISFYYEGGKSINDINFIENLKSIKPALSYSLKLKEIEEVIEYLNEEEFKKESILNFDLCAELLSKKTDLNKRYLDIKLEFIIDEFRFDFIDSFIEYLNTKSDTNLVKEFLNKVCDINTSFWKIINDKLDEKKKEQYFIYLVNNIEFQKIINLNIDNSLTTYLNERKELSNILEGLTIEISIFHELLKSLNIKFSELKDISKNKHSGTFNTIGVFCLYKINMFWMQNLLDVSEDAFYEQNYTLIKKRSPNVLSTYIFKNINEYVQNVYSHIHNANEDEKAVLHLLGNEQITYESIQIFLNANSTLISDLKQVHCNYWSLLTEKKRITPNISNLNLLFIEKDYIKREAFIKFLKANDNVEKIFFQHYPKGFTKLVQFLINSNDIEFKEFKQIIDNSLEEFSCKDLGDISDERLDYIIRHKINVNSENYSYLIDERTQKQTLLLLEQDTENIYSNIKDFEIADDYIYQIVKNIKYKKEDRFEIVNNYCSDKFPKDKEFLEVVMDLINVNILDSNIEVLRLIFKNEDIELNKRLELLIRYLHLEYSKNEKKENFGEQITETLNNLMFFNDMTVKEILKDKIFDNAVLVDFINMVLEPTYFGDIDDFEDNLYEVIKHNPYNINTDALIPLLQSDISLSKKVTLLLKYLDSFFIKRKEEEKVLTSELIINEISVTLDINDITLIKELIKFEEMNNYEVELINHYVDETYLKNDDSFTKNIAEKIKNNISRIEYEKYLLVMESSIVKSKKIELFLLYKFTNRDELYEVLNAIDNHSFKNINNLNKKRYINIKNSPEYLRILEKLESIQYISTVTNKEKSMLKCNFSKSEKTIIDRYL
ncbi:YobI family P-loop NTPase [Poseidonibacter ostreae]|uniref:YobI-like P-loop NTPase domain-containing protein n=1 Tax=Poseidonibacter ostreae TaxID=2654171 RepID=A0ABQ6VPH3_9BACT|nr:hypothetical protein [Poseidonibacter ostreae]KAB7892559.1 hypothetical protein GBG18_01505 [Poseidonibacter ostreae]